MSKRNIKIKVNGYVAALTAESYVSERFTLCPKTFKKLSSRVRLRFLVRERYLGIHGEGASLREAVQAFRSSLAAAGSAF